MTPQRFRKRPVEVSALRWTGENFEDVCQFCPTAISVLGKDFTYQCIIPTLEGNMFADAGDWIIRGVKGEFYPCKPDIFAATYMKARK